MTVTGTTGSNHRQYRQAVLMLGSGRLSLRPLVTLKRPHLEIEEAFADAASGEQLKVVVLP